MVTHSPMPKARGMMPLSRRGPPSPNSERGGGVMTRNVVKMLKQGGATTIGPDATHPPAICQNLPGGGGVGAAGGWVGGGGGIGSSAGGGGSKEGGLRTTHYYHMHTSRGGGCLGAWGYRGMYAIIAISHLCQEESLKGLKDQRHSIPLK